MTFKKGNTLQSHSGTIVRQKNAEWNYVRDFILEEGAMKFLEILKNQADENPEKYLANFIAMLEFFRPKLARQEVQHTGEPFTVQIVNYLPENKQITNGQPS